MIKNTVHAHNFREVKQVPSIILHKVYRSIVVLHSASTYHKSQLANTNHNMKKQNERQHLLPHHPASNFIHTKTTDISTVLPPLHLPNSVSAQTPSHTNSTPCSLKQRGETDCAIRWRKRTGVTSSRRSGELVVKNFSETFLKNAFYLSEFRWYDSKLFLNRHITLFS